MVREGEGEKPLARPERNRPAVAGPVSAATELAQVRETDRLVKASTRLVKAKGVPESARRSRKPGPQRPAPKPRTRR
jgi:ribonuclease R